MSELFETNRSHFLKIFETHQFKGLVSYTDILKICSAFKIFPDLLDSQGIQKAFASVSSANFHKITYLEFEEFLKMIAMKLFGSSGNFRDCAEIFLAHIRAFALKSYGTEIKTVLHKRRSASKGIKTKKNLSMASIKNQSMAKLPETTRHLNLKKSMFDMIAPTILKMKKKRNKLKETLTDRRGENGHVEAPVKVKMAKARKMIRVFAENMKKTCKNEYLRNRKLEVCESISALSKDRFLLLKLFFQIWRWNI